MMGLGMIEVIQQIRQGVGGSELERLLTKEQLQSIGTYVEPEKGRTLLHVAAAVGNQSVVEWLLAQGALLNAKDTCGEATPALLACAKRQEKMVRFLLERGASATERDSNEWDLLLTAADCGATAIGKWLLETGHSDPKSREWRGYTALHMACSCNHTDFVLMLLEGGYIGANERDSEGVTPLCVACDMHCNASIELVAALLEHGASLHECDRYGITPLGRARSCHRADLVSLIESKLGAHSAERDPLIFPRTCHTVLPILVQQGIIKP